MDAEAARKELAARRNPDAVLTRVRNAGGLVALLAGDRLRPDLRSLLEETYSQEHEYRRHYFIEGKRGELGRIFAPLAADERSALFRTLLPGISDSVEAAWNHLALRPYLTGLVRRPFRCPQSPEALADVRGRWLLETTILLGDYQQDVQWVAAWAPHLAVWWGGQEIGWLLAGVIDAGGQDGDEVFEILRASAAGEHEIGQMGRHVTQALLSCSRPDAWQYVEKLLLAAGRQEGLRQVVLESVDEAHPQAFRRMLRLIREENLARFSATVRAFDVWFGFLWDGASAIKVDEVIDRVLLFLDDPAARAAALEERDAETVYLALWSTAFDDVDAAIPLAIPLLTGGPPERRFAATHFLVQAFWTDALPPLVDALADEDLRVAARALDAFSTDLTSHVNGPRLFERLEGVMARLPKRSQRLPAIVWPWTGRKLEKPQVAAAMSANAGGVPSERMLPYIRDLDAAGRENVLRRLTGLPSRWEVDTPPQPQRPLTGEIRRTVLECAGDASPEVRRTAFAALSGHPVLPDEASRLVDLLGRTPGDLRTGCLERLRELDDQALLDCADRLLGDASDRRRMAGLELLRDASESGRTVDAARERVVRYASDRDDLSDAERLHVDAVLGSHTDQVTHERALGLVDPEALRRWDPPRRIVASVESAAAHASLESLAALVLSHQHVEVDTRSGEKRLLVEAGLPSVLSASHAEDGHLTKLPLAETWKEWLFTREAALLDPDGFELLRALVARRDETRWQGEHVRQLTGGERWSAGTRFLQTLVEWCVLWQRPARGAGFLLDGLEASLAALTEEDFATMAERTARVPDGYAHVFLRNTRDDTDRRLDAASALVHQLHWWQGALPDMWEPQHAARAYGLLRWFQLRSGGYGELTLWLSLVVDASRAGAVDAAEFIDLLVGPESRQRRPGLLREVSGRKPAKPLAEHTELLALVERCRRRIVEIECQRGDRPTAASAAALDLRWSGGLETLAQALPALGRSKFARTASWFGADSRQETLSHLILRSTPRPEDTPPAFAAWARSARIGERRLIELAMYAPQWARHVNHVLGWAGLESAVWWLQAHTKDDRSWSLQELKEAWAAEVSERTPLSAQDLTEGAVDVQWFRDTFAQLGPERWRALDAAAKYAASSAGHTRAQLFARAMAGTVSRSDLTDRIGASRHQDSVRALGLLPLAPGDAGRQDLAERYRLLQEFRRQSRRFGSQRQQSERRAVDIALANLARTAGYRDPQRLQWTMERDAVAALAGGPLVRQKGDVSITLSIAPDGTARLEANRAGKALQSIPAALRKDPEVVELKEAVQELRRQRSRVKGSLEEAMCRGDEFTGAELQELFAHPVLAPALSQLVFIGDDVAGYPVDAGQALVDHDGRRHAVATDQRLRPAHAYDLFAEGTWSAWQHECFRSGRVQPFKQVFREVYPITETEREVQHSRRYAGHQVNPRQALSLFGGRGWVAHPEEGLIRTFHREGITARLYFQQAFFTPADVEGLTLEAVVFTPKGEWREMWLRDIPPRVFSETMRDIDLVVSVAHRGGVDPEATASTVEMRAALVRETCALLDLSNVEVQSTHALVRGELGSYAVHLGSAGASVLPGTALSIVAVHSQHRGRLFLPFADEDPKTAEVLAKVLLLSRDREIKDPNILDQIRRATGMGV